MIKNHLPFKTNLETQFSNISHLLSFAGGAYFFAYEQSKYYVISDSGTMADFLDENDDAELFDKLITVYEFSDKSECRNFINQIFNDRFYEQNKNIPKVLL